MKDDPVLIIPALTEIILTPAEAVDAAATPIRDDSGGIIIDGQGLQIYEG
jgi:hypothetical protein